MIKLKNLNINNFKAFETINLHFEDANFIVLDGPNGFGKTSVFDAIELLFTGEIKRYNRMCDEVVDKRGKFEEHPFLCETSIKGDIIISAEIECMENNYILKRRLKRDNLVEKDNIINVPTTLMISYDLINPKFTIISDEINFFEKAIGKNYLRNFEFVNYVEQEENLSFLKQGDKERQKAIAHLFKISEAENELAKLKKLQTRINTLCSKKSKDEIIAKDKEIEEIKATISGEESKSEYIKIFPSKSLFWDLDKIDFNVYTPVNVLGTESEFYKLKRFITEKDEYYKDKSNKKLEELLQLNGVMNDFLEYSAHVDSYDSLKEQYEKVINIEAFLSDIKGDITNFITSCDENLPKCVSEVMKNEVFVSEYSLEVIDLKKKHQESSALEKSLSSMKTARSNLIKKDKACAVFPKKNSVCTLCGYDWNERQILIDSISNQTEALKTFIKSKDNVLSQMLDSFKEKYCSIIIKSLNEYLNSNGIDKEYFDEFKKFYNSTRKDKCLRYSNSINEMSIEYKDLIDKKFHKGKVIKSEDLILRIENSKVEVNIELSQYNDYVFKSLFDNKVSEVQNVSQNDIVIKEKYLRKLINENNSSVLKEKEAELEASNKQYNQALAVSDKVKKLKKICDDTISDYKAKVISDIEILFHLYSGRIVQDRKGGNGLFINNDKGIRFLDNPNSSYDALFKLSSGQLSALIISFTLALNKKYSQDKLLFIDDPVQTLDDLNVAALIELLRNEFNDRQIFIATHEDMMSAYMRYKFMKYNIQTHHISMSKVQLEQIQ